MAFSSQEVVAFQLTGNAANDDLDEYINMNKEKFKGIGQWSVTLHIEDFRTGFSFVQPMLKMLH